MTLPRPIIAAQFFDQKNPARGWQITYPIGPGTLTCKTGRSFTYVFMCDRTTPAPPTTSGNYTFIDEISSCNYAAFMYSQVGCPTRAWTRRTPRSPARPAPARLRAPCHPRAPFSPALILAECPRTAKGVCNNQGICGFDKAANTAKCYCNSGYNVADCSVTSRAPSGGAIFGALSGGSVLGALCVVAYSFFRLRKTAPAGAPGGDGFYASG